MYKFKEMKRNNFPSSPLSNILQKVKEEMGVKKLKGEFAFVHIIEAYKVMNTWNKNNETKANLEMQLCEHYYHQSLCTKMNLVYINQYE